MHLRRLSNNGFTVIETIIVLAIAGLILLIVFEAIPALDRSSRNNERRQDAQTILEAVSRYELSNSGTVPPQANLQGYLSLYYKLYYYTVGNVTVPNPPTNVTNIYTSYPEETNPDVVTVYNHAKCDPNTQGPANNVGAGYGDVVALYAIENGGGGVISECYQL